MPNVNYRGKLPSDDLSTCEPLDLEQQDPDVLELDLTGPEPRDSQGMGSAPSVDPWPPLSRGQVVELHEALADFLSMMENGYGDGEVQDAAHAATRLESKLLDLGLGMLPTIHKRPAPPVRPFTQEQAEKLEEALASFRRDMEASKGIRSNEDQQDMIWGAAVELDGLLVEMNLGRPATMSRQTSVREEEVQEGPGDISALSRFSKPREEPTTDEDSGPGAMSWQRAEEFGSPFCPGPAAAPSSTGTPSESGSAPKRTWTHEEVERAVEEVQSRAGLPRYMTEGVPNPTATELAILESMGRRSPPVQTVTLFRDALGQEVEPKPGDTIKVGEAAAPSSYCAPIFEWADRMKAEYRRERWEGDPIWAETETMLRKVVFALRGFMSGWDRDPTASPAREATALLSLLRDAGIETLLPKHMSLAGIPADELGSWPKATVEESRRIDEKIAQAAHLLTEAGILAWQKP